MGRLLLARRKPKKASRSAMAIPCEVPEATPQDCARRAQEFVFRMREQGKTVNDLPPAVLEGLLEDLVRANHPLGREWHTKFLRQNPQRIAIRRPPTKLGEPHTLLRVVTRQGIPASAGGIGAHYAPLPYRGGGGGGGGGGGDGGPGQGGVDLKTGRMVLSGAKVMGLTAGRRIPYQPVHKYQVRRPAFVALSSVPTAGYSNVVPPYMLNGPQPQQFVKPRVEGAYVRNRPSMPVNLYTRPGLGLPLMSESPYRRAQRELPQIGVGGGGTAASSEFDPVTHTDQPTTSNEQQRAPMTDAERAQNFQRLWARREAENHARILELEERAARQELAPDLIAELQYRRGIAKNHPFFRRAGQPARQAAQEQAARDRRRTMVFEPDVALKTRMPRTMNPGVPDSMEEARQRAQKRPRTSQSGLAAAGAAAANLPDPAIIEGNRERKRPIRYGDLQGFKDLKPEAERVVKSAAFSPARRNAANSSKQGLAAAAQRARQTPMPILIGTRGIRAPRDSSFDMVPLEDYANTPAYTVEADPLPFGQVRVRPPDVRQASGTPTVTLRQRRAAAKKPAAAQDLSPGGSPVKPDIDDAIDDLEDLEAELEDERIERSVQKTLQRRIRYVPPDPNNAPRPKPSSPPGRAPATKNPLGPSRLRKK